jgi:hypothetical protein
MCMLSSSNDCFQVVAVTGISRFYDILFAAPDFFLSKHLTQCHGLARKSHQCLRLTCQMRIMILEECHAYLSIWFHTERESSSRRCLSDIGVGKKTSKTDHRDQTADGHLSLAFHTPTYPGLLGPDLCTGLNF